MLKKIIIMENGKEYQYDTLEDIVRELLGEKYYEMNDDEKMHQMEMRACANCLNNRKKIAKKREVNEKEDIDNLFIIGDEKTYILSLLTTNNIILLERKDSNIFTSSIDKEKIEDNYIVVNTFAKRLLREELN